MPMWTGGDRNRMRRVRGGHTPAEDVPTEASTVEHGSPKTELAQSTEAAGLGVGGNSTVFDEGQKLKPHTDNSNETVTKPESSVSTPPTTAFPNDETTTEENIFDLLRQTIDSTLVSDVNTGLVFSSTAVFACHDHLVNNPVLWDKLSVPFMFDEGDIWSTVDMELMIKEMSGPHVFPFPPSGSLEDYDFCYPDDIHSCPENYENQKVAVRCQEGSIALVRYLQRLYRNPFCMFCNYNIHSTMTFFEADKFLIGRSSGPFHIFMKISSDTESINFVLSRSSSAPYVPEGWATERVMVLFGLMPMY